MILSPVGPRCQWERKDDGQQAVSWTVVFALATLPAHGDDADPVAEELLIAQWLLMSLPPAQNKAALEYRMFLTVQFPTDLINAGFRLDPAARCAVEDAWSKTERINAIDPDAGAAHFEKLIQGLDRPQFPSESVQPETP